MNLRSGFSLPIPDPCAKKQKNRSTADVSLGATASDMATTPVPVSPSEQNTSSSGCNYPADAPEWFLEVRQRLCLIDSVHTKLTTVEQKLQNVVHDVSEVKKSIEFANTKAETASNLSQTTKNKVDLIEQQNKLCNRN
jgi:hypothetical protein